jgi:hypothetical protein
VRRINRKRIVVAGWSRGERIVMGMGRHRSCPVHFVRVRDGRGFGAFDRRGGRRAPLDGFGYRGDR